MVMPSQLIRRAVFGASPIIRSDDLIDHGQIQPASIDLRLGRVARRVWAAALPRDDQFVIDLIASPERKKYQFGLAQTELNALEKDHTYVIELKESCNLPQHMWMEFSPKSSTGRCDVFARVLCDRYPHYDITPKGYHGPLWLEVTPLSFDVTVKEGLSLVQGRIKTDKTTLLDSATIAELHAEQGILYDKNGLPLDQCGIHVHDNELYYSVDLDRPIVGFYARKNVSKALDLTIDKSVPEELRQDSKDFWIPIERPKSGRLVLEPNVFYLLATKERTRIPPTVCGQVTSFKITTGELRPHYAGFFDPGFGGAQGTNGVLEVRARDVPFEISDGAPICSMKFERMLEVPERLYGQDGSSYADPRPSISKHFKNRYEVWESI